MSTPVIGGIFKGFPGGQIFATGETLEVDAAISGITMAVADLYRALDGQEGLDPLLARQSCAALVRVNAPDGTPVKNLTHENFRIAMFRSVGDWASIPVTSTEATDASIHAPPDFGGQLDGVYLLTFLASDDIFDDGGLAYKGTVNYLHQIVFLIQVTSFLGTRPIKVSRGHTFATMPFFYTSFPNGELKLAEK